ncbi:MAG TPA: hypothetical protein DDZ41_01015 [Flavobacterium sp.]|nr:hypothetical protein [Flavobacterium sp.]
MKKLINTSKFGEIDFEVYDLLHKTVEKLKKIEKEFKRLNIPLSFILAPKEISKVTPYKLRQFYIDMCHLQLSAFATCDKDLESLSDILSIDTCSKPTEEELEYEAELKGFKITPEMVK